MKRKIKITSKMVKKVVLWALLVVLVVGFGIIVINSFDDGNILSNNTVLNDLDYSGEYRLYLEKKIIADTHGDYETTITNEIEKHKNIKEEEQEKKLAEINKNYQDSIKEANETAAAEKESRKNAYEAKIEEIENSDNTDARKEDLKAEQKKSYEEKIKLIETDLNKTLQELESQNSQDIIDHEQETKKLIASIDEDYVVEELIKTEMENENVKTLTELVNKRTPEGYVYASNDNNSAIKAEFDSTKTEEANTEESVKNDTLTGLTFTIAGDNTEYVYSGKTGTVVYQVNVNKGGFYNLLLDYVPYSNTQSMNASNRAIDEESGGATIERVIRVDGQLPYDDLRNVSFLRSWSDGGNKFVDATGNEIKPKQVEKTQRLQQYIKDSVGYVTEPYLVYFSEGEHTIEIESIKENMGIANVYLTSKEDYMSYSDYQKLHLNAKKIDGGIAYKIQGEGGASQYYVNNKSSDIFTTNVTRSSSTIYGVSDRTSAYNSVMTQNDEGSYEEASASPVKIVLNTIGGSKWSSPGDWIKWTVNVKETGLYQISLRSKQNVSRGLFSTRKLAIDGAVPFEEAMNCKFVYGSNWSIVTLGNDDEAYYFYLEAGEHTISLECTLGDYASEIAKIQGIIDDLNGAYRKIIQKTGISPDPYMDYFKNASGKKLIAELKVTFQECIDVINEVSTNITKISGEKSSETASLETMAIQLNQFIKDETKIQKNLSDFSTNISSLGTWILDVSEQALSIDYLIVHSDDYKLPKANPNFFGSLWFSVKGFFGSFFFDYESVGINEENENWETIDVWLCTSESQGREQANAISAMISEACEDETSKIYGLNVKLKVVSSDVLLTATLAGKGPDVAINIANGTPVNYALRGAAYDLTEFTTENIQKELANSTINANNINSFQEIALGEELELNGGTRRFQTSAMTPYEFNGGYYALPYTQSYLMMFYRTDMFEQYGWEVPTTWSEVIQLIPELQIMNFQFYLPLNTSGASSVVNQIFASYLYQNVDDTTQAFYRTMYNDRGEPYMESNFDSPEAQDAFEFWCSFYTEYSFPLSASFVNRFRSGETPIGIVSYDIYNTLAVSAPEIRGKWSFALLPGTVEVDEQGNKTIDHKGAASGMAMMMMGTTEKPYEAWAFMDWFTDSDTQVNYAREIEAILGAAARHNTANVAAFTRLAWTEEEKEVLMEQWNYTVGVPEVAGGYYTGRNLENAFREVVNNNYNPRQILSDYILTINSEIDRKREEFGLASSSTYAKKGDK